MDKTEKTIALDNLERQALLAAEDAIVKYFQERGFDVAEWTETEFKSMIEACVLTWKARYETICELHDDIPFGKPSPADKKYEIDDEIPF